MSLFKDQVNVQKTKAQNKVKIFLFFYLYLELCYELCMSNYALTTCTKLKSSTLSTFHADWQSPFCTFLYFQRLLESVICWPVCRCVYKILVILCCKLLQFCCNSFENLYKHWLHTEILQGVILKCQPPPLQELSPA